MRIVARRLSISVVTVNILICMSIGYICMEGLIRYVVPAAAFVCGVVLVIYVKRQIDPNPFIPVFASSGLTALAMSGMPAGLLFIVIPLIGCMTGIVRPDPEKKYAKHTAVIAVVYFGTLWSLRWVPVWPEGNIITEAVGMAGALVSMALIVHVEEYRREMLRHEAAKLAESAGKDPLTGLNTRKNLDRFILEQAKRIDTFSIIMMDIDNFKKVNDTYGHVEGDAILKDLALVIQCHVRVQDCAFRYGGEEFVIVCPRTDSEGAGQLADRIRVAFSSKLHTYEEFTDPELRERRYTVSLGVAESRMGDFKDAKELIGHCDEALYEAKHNGKNQVRFYRAPGDMPRLGG